MFGKAEMGPAPKQASFLFSGAHILPGSAGRAPNQTNSKSKLIAAYISLFQKVTKGGLYIDGFAAPQSRHHEDAWTARRVLEVSPPRLRTLWLCDKDPAGLLQLQKLKDQHHLRPRSRRVIVMHGDFNRTVHLILKSGRITRKAAVFALLDQRNTECHWSTVEALARYAGRHKIELLYFVGSSWLHRSLTQAQTSERIAGLNSWWGGEGWRVLVPLKQVEMVKCIADRFSAELGYRFVHPYPIQRVEDGARKFFYLIHASDHPEAPNLMSRAYMKIMGDIEGSPVDSQRRLL